MNTLIVALFLGLFIFPNIAWNQRKEYSSKEESNHVRAFRNRNRHLKSVTDEEVTKLSYRYIKISKSSDSISAKKIRSMDSIADKSLRDFIKKNENKPEGDSLIRKEFTKSNNVCTSTNEKGITATLFLDSKYDQNRQGYWIRLEGNSVSRNYYLGITEYHYLRLFDYEKSIWKNDSTLHFNAIRSRFIEPTYSAFESPRIKTIDNNLCIEISISDLIIDSDSDGLTDIEEEKLALNPFSKDTDGDGVDDSIDHNPRFKNEISNETLLYKAILQYEIDYDTATVVRDNKIQNNGRFYYFDDDQLYFIVSDDSNLQHAKFDHGRYIILSNLEFETYRKKFPITPYRVDVSPKFKIDQLKNAFFIRVERMPGLDVFLVKKTNSGYEITTYSSGIY